MGGAVGSVYRVGPYVNKRRQAGLVKFLGVNKATKISWSITGTETYEQSSTNKCVGHQFLIPQNTFIFKI
jgi:hypothetical protein